MRSKPAGSDRNHRFHALCPYFAMFPPSFACEAIRRTTSEGELVLDPFCGRGTTLLEALLNNREAIAADINPLAALISMAKAQPPTLDMVLSRIDELEMEFGAGRDGARARECQGLPPFFRHAFAASTLEQILYLRKALRWRRRKVDRFIAALVLGHLHGESSRSPNYLSNHMPHTIALKPAYAVRYWRERGMLPPTRDVFSVLRSRARFRFADGVPPKRGRVVREDVRKCAHHFVAHRGRVAAIITSPPYLDVTNCEEDQWLRLWFLGGPPNPTYGRISRDDRHTSQWRYFQFLQQAWRGIAPLVRRSAHLVCRIGAKKLSQDEVCRRLLASLRGVWPRCRLVGRPQVSELRKRQTNVFRPGSVGCRYEYDFHFVLD